MVEAEELLDLSIFRPLAFVFIKAIYKTNITPNQITLFSFFCGIMAAVSFGFGRPSAVVAAAGLYGFSIVLDCADGQLARLKRNGTRLGRILDGLIDYVIMTAIYIGIGVGLTPGADHPVALWLLLAAAAMSNIFHSMAFDYYRNRFLECVEGSAPEIDEDYRSFKAELVSLRMDGGGAIRRAAITIYLKYLTFQKRIASQWECWRSSRKVNEEEFYRKNRYVLRGWTFLGSTTQGTLLIVASLLGRFDLYFWGMIVVGNIWSVVMFFIQSRVDNRLAQEATL
jgi:hypothetical protein